MCEVGPVSLSWLGLTQAEEKFYQNYVQKDIFTPETEEALKT